MVSDVAVEKLEWPRCRVPNFTVIGIVLLLVVLPDHDDQP